MTSTARQADPADTVVPANEEAVEAWDGPLFDRFVRFRHIVTTGLGAHGEEALACSPPRSGAALREGLAEFDGPDGVVAPASTWIVTATAPGTDG